MDQKYVFAVESGEYSDYGITAIFSTKKVAAAVAKRLNGEHSYTDYRVREWLLLDDDPPRFTVYVKECFRGKVSESAQVTEGWDDWEHRYIGRVTRGLGFGQWDGGNNYRYWGLDRARVQRAFDDYHARREAERQGLT